MTLTLQTIRPPRGAKKSKKRRGRGNASGHGTYSTRGQKGQRARSGGRHGLKVKGIKNILQSIPKQRGFISQRAKLAVVNLGDLEKKFNSGELVTPKKLKEKGLIKTDRFGVKILAEGKLTKKLKVQAQGFSKEAERKIKEIGGEIIVK